MASKQLRIGVFFPEGAQFLDAATVDVLASMSKEYLSPMAMLPKHIGAMAPSTKITYITSPRLFPEVPFTAGLTVRATHTWEDKAVAPGQLDIVVVPGPDPTSTFEEGATEWLRKQYHTKGVDVLCICTGVFLCGAAGILEGKNVSGPRGLQDELAKRFPGVKLVGDKYRWVQDGNFWSSGGVTNGNDLMVAYARANSQHWPGPVAEIGAVLTDVGDRPQIFGEGQRRYVLGVAWQLVKGWLMSLVSSSKAKGKHI
ncbi:hypothetical protein FZEAL_7792 [Fusarium zealandicum]|uniref:DJ-1/PfpI domain-containing protein n=1 Tax=Fusarium zealandicum TaxID=1053134 RepID=A0A8H4XI52_9HYPO|nr:hypothetical protein FZEAL_7792 [Fusarium zealandicum]